MPGNLEKVVLRRTPRLGGAPLDPPPFFLEAEIRLPTRFMGLVAIAAGILVLVALRLAVHPDGHALPSLGVLFVSAVAGAGFYGGFRLLCYWGAWAWVIRQYPSAGGVHFAARGELPRNWFLLVLFAPILSFGMVCVILSYLGSGFGPQLWSATAVVVGISLRDLRAGSMLLFRDSATWVKETPMGLDVLRPVNVR